MEVGGISYTLAWLFLNLHRQKAITITIITITPTTHPIIIPIFDDAYATDATDANDGADEFDLSGVIYLFEQLVVRS